MGVLIIVNKLIENRKTNRK